MQLEFIQLLHTLRSSLLDRFFIALNFFDTGAFFFLLIPAIWFGKSWRAGLRLLSIMLLSSFSVGVLKNFFAAPRPFHLMPELGIIKVSSFSFPSGGATHAMLLSCLFLTHSKSRFKWPIALLFWFFVSLSRVYLGVHFPVDILGGWVLGLSLWAVYIYVFPKIEKWLEKQKRLTLFFLSQLAPMIPFFLNAHVRTLCVLFMGITSTLFFIRPLKAKTLQRSLFQGASGAVLAFLFYLGLKHLFQSSTLLVKFGIPFLTGLGVGVLGSYLCKVGSKKTNTHQPLC